MQQLGVSPSLKDVCFEFKVKAAVGRLERIAKLHFICCHFSTVFHNFQCSF